VVDNSTEVIADLATRLVSTFSFMLVFGDPEEFDFEVVVVLVYTFCSECVGQCLMGFMCFYIAYSVEEVSENNSVL